MVTRISNTLRSLVASRIFQICVGASFSLIALYLVAQQADVHAVIAVLGHASPIALIAALLSVIANTLAKTTRWRLLLGPRGREIPGMRILSALLGGQLLNALLPVRLGELSRAYDIGGLGPGRTFVLGGVVIEKIIDMACLAALVLVLIALLPVPAWMTRSAYFSLAAGIVVVVVILILVRRLDWLTEQLQVIVGKLPSRIRASFAPRLQSGLSSFRILSQTGVQSRISLWSLVIWGSAILTNQLVLAAFNIQLPITAACLVLLALMVGTSVPNIAAGLGIFEYLCVMSLGAFGVDSNTALSYGLMLHVLVLVPMALVGPVYLVSQWRTRRAGLV